MLHKTESIQIKWLFRKERALTLDCNHFSLLRHFNYIGGQKNLLFLDLLMTFENTEKEFLLVFLSSRPLSFCPLSASSKTLIILAN